MSGGSYNYLCLKYPEELFGQEDYIAKMRDRLAEVGAVDAAAETESVLLVMAQYEARMRARLDRLNEVWRSVEWCDSGDTGPDHIESALADYRGEADHG